MDLTCRLAATPSARPTAEVIGSPHGLLPAAEGPAAAGVGGRAVDRHVVQQLEIPRLLLEHAAERHPVERLGRGREQAFLWQRLERLAILLLERAEQRAVLFFVDDEVAQ